MFSDYLPISSHNFLNLCHKGTPHTGFLWHATSHLIVPSPCAQGAIVTSSVWFVEKRFQIFNGKSIFRQLCVLTTDLEAILWLANKDTVMKLREEFIKQDTLFWIGMIWLWLQNEKEISFLQLYHDLIISLNSWSSMSLHAVLWSCMKIHKLVWVEQVTRISQCLLKWTLP